MKKELNDLELGKVSGGKKCSKFEKKFDDMTISEQVNMFEDAYTHHVGNKEYNPHLTKFEKAFLIAYLVGRKGCVKVKDGFDWCYEKALG